MTPKGKHYAFAQLTDAEYSVLRAAARKDGLTISDFVRRCINACLCEQGDEGLLLDEKGGRTRRPRG